MEYRFVIDGTLPGCNELINVERRNRFAAASLKKKTEASIVAVIQEQLPNIEAKTPVVINYLWVVKNRRHDRSNVAFAKKFVEDAMVKSGLLKNDGWFDVVGFTDSFKVDSEHPRVEVTINEVCVI